MHGLSPSINIPTKEEVTRFGHNGAPPKTAEDCLYEKSPGLLCYISSVDHVEYCFLSDSPSARTPETITVTGHGLASITEPVPISINNTTGLYVVTSTSDQTIETWAGYAVGIVDANALLWWPAAWTTSLGEQTFPSANFTPFETYWLQPDGTAGTADPGDAVSPKISLWRANSETTLDFSKDWFCCPACPFVAEAALPITLFADPVSASNGFTGSHGPGSEATHWHANPDGTLPSFTPFLLTVGEVAGFFGDEESRAFAEFLLPAGEITQAVLQIQVLDMVAAGLSGDAIDGLYGQGSSTETVTVELYAGDGNIELSDYNLTPTGVAGTVDASAQTGSELIQFDVLTLLNQIKDAAATHLGVRLRQTTGDQNSGGITFDNFSLALNGGSLPLPPPPPPVGTEIFAWTAQEPGTQKVNWDIYRTAGLPFDYGGGTRPRGLNAVFHTTSAGYRMLAQQNNEVGVMRADGRLEFERFADAGNDHSQINMSNVAAPWSGNYLVKDIGYQFNFAFEFDTDLVTEAQWKNPAQNPWTLLWEMWMPMNWGGWVGGGDVPLQLILNEEGGSGVNELFARVRGAPGATPTDYTVETSVKVADFLTGRHEFRIETHIDPSGTNAFFRLFMDDFGTPIVDIPVGSQPIGLEHDPGNGVIASMLPAWGLYTSGSTLAGAKTTWDYFNVRQLP